MKYIASFSGGKDSTATVILAHEHKEPLDIIVFSEVMFDENTSGELPEHIDFVENVAFPLFEKWGYTTITLRAEATYMDNFNHISTRGKSKGKRRGFPMAGKCAINRDCKLKPISDFYKQQGGDFVQYIGIAKDEPKRLERLRGTNRISLLEKYGYTEEMAFDLCREYGLLSPTYEFSKRGGCWFCPNARKKELRHTRDCHNDLWVKLLELEKGSGDAAGYIWNTLTNKSIQSVEEQFRQEDAQITIFDYLKTENK